MFHSVPWLLCKKAALRCFRSRKSSRYCTSNNVSTIVNDLRSIMENNNSVLTDINDTLPYTTDWLGSYSGGQVVVLPTNTEQVSDILRYCHEKMLAIVPQGGNTGLVGGGVGRTNSADIILSLKKMNNIIEIDSDTSAIVCEAGCVLEDLEKYANERGNFSVPLDLGSKGSCMIGGCVSTNAGGLRVLRYGSMHHNVLGLEVVLPDGSVVNMLRKLRKDNAGYQLKHLFIGSEGTLGVITKVSMQLVAKPTSVHTMFIEVSSFSNVVQVLQVARQELGELLSAYEYMDQNCIDALLEVFPQFKSTISRNGTGNPRDKSFYILIETSGYHATHDLNRIHMFSELLLNDQSAGVLGASLSQDLNQVTNIWKIRENIPIALAQLNKMVHSESLNHNGVQDRKSGVVLHKLFKYDISLVCTDMVGVVGEVVKGLRSLNYAVICHSMDSTDIDTGVDAIAAGSMSNVYDMVTPVGDGNVPGGFCSPKVCLEVYNYGHIGDNNLHLNILLRPQAVHINPSLRHADSNATNVDLSAVYAAIHHDIDELVYRHVIEKNGSISAEHGIGQLKSQGLVLAKGNGFVDEKARHGKVQSEFKRMVMNRRGTGELQVMKTLKQCIDPKNIMNPGKIF